MSARYVLFNPGPVNLAPEVRERAMSVDLCHRQPEFDELDGAVRRKLHAASGLPAATHELSLMPGSGTLAVDAALATLVRGRVFVVDNGLYCARIAATLARIEGATPQRVDCGLGVPPDLGALEQRVERERPDWIACVHHETTTGLLNPLEPLADLAERHGCRLFVDAVSSLGVHAPDARADVVCFNSSKCLEGMPGVAGVLWRRGLEPHATIPALDLAPYARGVPTTPNVQAYLALDAALDLLLAEDRPARYARRARAVWRLGGERFQPLLAPEHRSHVLCAFRLGGRDPDELLRRAHARGFVIYAGQRELRDEVFRVANMGAVIEEPQIAQLFEVLAAP